MSWCLDSEACPSLVVSRTALSEQVDNAESAGQSPACIDLDDSSNDLQVAEQTSDSRLSEDAEDHMSCAVIVPSTVVAQDPSVDGDADLQSRSDIVFKGSHVAHWQQKLCKVHSFEFKYTQ